MAVVLREEERDDRPRKGPRGGGAQVRAQLVGALSKTQLTEFIESNL